jgi:uncharacterized short protein YbdD (DUF466 family)
MANRQRGGVMAIQQGRDQFVAWMHDNHPDTDVRSMRKEEFGWYGDDYRDHRAGAGTRKRARAWSC